MRCCKCYTTHCCSIRCAWEENKRKSKCILLRSSFFGALGSSTITLSIYKTSVPIRGGRERFSKLQPNSISATELREELTSRCVDETNSKKIVRSL